MELTPKQVNSILLELQKKIASATTQEERMKLQEEYEVKSRVFDTWLRHPDSARRLS